MPYLFAISRDAASLTVSIVLADEVELRLDIDESIDLAKAFEGVAELISLAPGVGWILLAHTISGIIRSSFVSAGITPSTIIMIVGETGMHKSSYVPLITQLYDRGKGIKVNGLWKRCGSTSGARVD